MAWRWIEAGRDVPPFLATIALFLLGYLGLVISNFPYLVPPSLTIWDTAAAPASQIFMLLGTLLLLPIILGYIAFIYWLFRGKVREGESITDARSRRALQRRSRHTPMRMSGNMPCTARGNERGTSATMSGNCAFSVAGGVPVLSAAGQTRMPPCVRISAGLAQRAAVRRPGEIDVRAGSARRAQSSGASRGSPLR